MSFEELDAARPALDDGNFLLELIRGGDLRRARKELGRLLGHYSRPGLSTAHRNGWVAWAKVVQKYIDSVKSEAT